MAVRKICIKSVRGTRSMILPLVAMLELLLLLVSVTFSWFERALDPILYGNGISTAEALMATFEVGSDGGTVDLGQYFDMGSKTKFSPVHSDDGVNFTSSNGIPMNAGEVHSAALSFQFKVESETDCEFWIDSLELFVNDMPVALRDVQREPPSIDEDEQPDVMSTEEMTEAVIDDTSGEESVDNEPIEGSTTENSYAENTDAEETSTTEATETEATTAVVTEASEPLEETATEDEMSSTRNSSTTSYASAFVICFNDGVSCERFTVAESLNYMSSGDKKLFSYSTGQDTIVTCSIWLDCDEAERNGVVIPEGATFEIDLLLASSWSATRTIRLADETTMLNEMYPQMVNDGYYVELVDAATNTVYTAVYDNESGVWCVEVPFAVEKFDVRYRSNGVKRETIATWDNIEGTSIQSFALMDEGVFLSTES